MGGVYFFKIIQLFRKKNISIVFTTKKENEINERISTDTQKEFKETPGSFL